jgi:hypothetical protein
VGRELKNRFLILRLAHTTIATKYRDKRCTQKEMHADMHDAPVFERYKQTFEAVPVETASHDYRAAGVRGAGVLGLACSCCQIRLSG